jgi:hypothetical protein
MEVPEQVAEIANQQGWTDQTLLQLCWNFLFDSSEPELSERFVEHLKNSAEDIHNPIPDCK